MTKFISILKLLWHNPLVTYVSLMFAEWFYFFCRRNCKATKIPTSIPMDSNKDGICDHCGQNYTVGMDKTTPIDEQPDKSETAKEVVLENKPKPRRTPKTTTTKKSSTKKTTSTKKKATTDSTKKTSTARGKKKSA